MLAEMPLKDTNRPYPPASNVISLMERLRSRNLPDRIDLEFLKDAGIAGSLVHRVAFALRFLGLVQGDVPTSSLRSIATSTDEEYRELMGSVVREAYDDVFAVIDPAKDDQERIVNFFRRYTPASQRERMVNFFLAMCRESGIETLGAPRLRSTGDHPRSKRTTTFKTPKGSKNSKILLPTETENAGPEQGRIHPSLELLVRSLPSPGISLSEARRQQWLDMAAATLAFIYPDDTEGGSPSSDNED